MLSLTLKMDDLIIYNFIEVEIPDFDSEFFDLWLSHIVKSHDMELGELSFVFCNDAYLLDINKSYLNHDYYTDIITFNYNEDISLSGDLFISIDMVRYNAELNNVSFFDELCRVMAHGVLHLIGFNDELLEEIAEMRSKEEWCLTERKCFT